MRLFLRFSLPSYLEHESFCRLNEEMIETLFPANSLNMNAKNPVRCQNLPDTNQENMVLDPKKSQNIAILLRALNVTVGEVCEALVEGGFLLSPCVFGCTSNTVILWTLY